MLSLAEEERQAADPDADLQDAGLPEPLGRRMSSFTQLVGQASGLQDLLRR